MKASSIAAILRHEVMGIGAPPFPPVVGDLRSQVVKDVLVLRGKPKDSPMHSTRESPFVHAEILQQGAQDVSLVSQGEEHDRTEGRRCRTHPEFGGIYDGLSLAINLVLQSHLEIPLGEDEGQEKASADPG